MSEQPSLNGDGTITIKTSSWNRVVRERDEAREECKAIAEKLDGIKRLCDKIEEKADWFREKAGQHLEERDEARKESEQQARLLGISAEREYALRGKIFELERKILQLEAK